MNQTTANSGFFLGERKKNPTLVPVISETSLIALAVFMEELGKNGWLSVFLIFFLANFRILASKKKRAGESNKGIFEI